MLATMETTFIVTPKPITLRAERLCADRDYPLSVAPEDCRRVFESLLSDRELRQLETEHWISVEIGLPGAARGRLFGTSHEGAASALITA
jgi:hypothetical protein